jgi:hypothetical protein
VANIDFVEVNVNLEIVTPEAAVSSEEQVLTPARNETPQ